MRTPCPRKPTATTSDTAVALRSVSHRFGKFQTLRDVDLTVRRGDVHGLLGLNGAGKTTTFRILLRLLRCQSGEITLFGRPQQTDWLSLASGIGATVEAPAFYEHLDGLTNLELLYELTGSDGGRTPEQVLELTDLSEAARVQVRKYSQGMQQRLHIAQALLTSPELLLLDEPTSNLDPRGIVDVRRLIRRLNREERVTVILASHQLSEVEEVCDRVTILHHGRVLAESSVAELFRTDECAVEIEVDRPPEALRLLQTAPWCFQPSLRDGILCTRVPRARRGELNSLLVKQGFAVSQLAEHRPTLEDYFHQTIAEDEP